MSTDHHLFHSRCILRDSIKADTTPNISIYHRATKFKELVKKYGYKFEANTLKRLDEQDQGGGGGGGASTTPLDSPTIPATPTSKKKKSKTPAAVSTPTDSAAAADGASPQTVGSVQKKTPAKRTPAKKRKVEMTTEDDSDES